MAHRTIGPVAEPWRALLTEFICFDLPFSQVRVWSFNTIEGVVLAIPQASAETTGKPTRFKLDSSDNFNTKIKHQPLAQCTQTAPSAFLSPTSRSLSAENA